jgi:peptidoglycan/LPS O-acetylase OafA/YrhL
MQSVTELAGKIQRERIQSIQILRAFAACAVVVFHATILVKDKTRSFNYIWSNGSAGVDLFFVISGFIILSSGVTFSRDKEGALKFLELRLVRLIPLYWLVTTVKLTLTFLAPKQSLINGVPTLWNVISSYLFIPSYNNSGRILPVVNVGWSLSFELLFYILFTICLLRNYSPLRFVGSALLMLAGLSLFRNESWPAFTSLADPFLIEFLLGMWIAKAYYSGLFKRIPLAFSCTLAAMGLLSLALSAAPDPWSRTLIWGGAAAISLIGALGLERFCVGQMVAMLVLIGEASYSLYLTHGFILPAVGFAASLAHFEGVTLSVFIIIGSLISSAIAAVFVFRFVEKPAMSFFRRQLHLRAKNHVPHPVAN